MGLVNMMPEGDKYVYEFNGHLDPKDWNVKVENGRLYVTGVEKKKKNSGEFLETEYKWDTKLSRYCASTEFTLEPGSYFPGVEVTAPGVHEKQHAGGKLRIVFPLAK